AAQRRCVWDTAAGCRRWRGACVGGWAGCGRDDAQRCVAAHIVAGVLLKEAIWDRLMQWKWSDSARDRSGILYAFVWSTALKCFDVVWSFRYRASAGIRTSLCVAVGWTA